LRTSTVCSQGVVAKAQEFDLALDRGVWLPLNGELDHDAVSKGRHVDQNRCGTDVDRPPVQVQATQG
jgi:hypothetical protein